MINTLVVYAAAAVSMIFGPAVPTVSTVSEGSMSIAAVCARFDGAVTVYTCAPSAAPDGAEILDLFEDGSASYPGWSYDGDTMTFAKS